MAILQKADLGGLLIQAQKGNSKALQALCKQLEGFVRGYFVKKFRDVALVDDLCQETYIRMLRNLPKIKEAMRLKGFVAKVAFHVMQDHFRSKYRRDEESLEQRFEQGLDVADAPSYRSDLQLDRVDIEKALEELPEKTRRVLLLKSDGHKYEEIAETTGLSVSGVKMQVKRGIEQLKFLLADVTIIWLYTTLF